jgi:hypothetical protein
MSGVMPFTKRYAKKTTFSHIHRRALAWRVKFAIVLFGLIVGILDGQLINSIAEKSVGRNYFAFQLI